MKKYAVIGKDVSRSLSPQIHKFISERTGNEIIYDRISINENTFDKSVKKLFNEYDGFNVTIPYKLSIMPHLNKIDGDAKTFGAVNTVRVSDLSGYNTDGAGFMLMLKINKVETDGKDILLLGAGGAGRSVAKKLAAANANVYVYDVNYSNSKRLEREFSNIAAVENIVVRPYYAIINATGVGMHESEGVSPLSEDVIKLCEVAIDLIYTPPKSKFLQIAENCGKRIINGFAMLFYQAYYAQCIFFNKSADEQQAVQLFNEFREGFL